MKKSFLRVEYFGQWKRKVNFIFNLVFFVPGSLVIRKKKILLECGRLEQKNHFLI